MNRALRIAAAAVCFAAADTYVVVLALPEMMTAAGIPLDELQRAAPIVSGFLLGYVALLPLVGRLADLHGRRQVLTVSLLLFAVGSLFTASSYDLGSMVTGRFLQGLGAGGLVPATFALVADLYPVDERGRPLAWVGAAQELGSVLGPVLAAVVLAFGPWRDLFWVNLTVGLLFALLLVKTPAQQPKGPLMHMLDSATEVRRDRWVRPAQVLLALLAGIALAIAMLRPRQLVDSVAWGGPFVPWTGASRWVTPIGVVAITLTVLFVVTLRPWRWHRLLRGVDVVGALLVGLALAGIVLAFAGADSEKDVLAPGGWWLLGGSLVFGVAFLLRQRTSSVPLVPRGILAPVPAWGSLVFSLFVGAAAVAAVVDIPLAARLTVYPHSQLGAAFVLLRMLICVPIGAVIGGRLSTRFQPGVIAAVGMVFTIVGFALMAQWDAHSLSHWQATIPLVIAGLGFGLCVTPDNVTLLAITPPSVHGLVNALDVVARMVGMLVGLSILTAIGLHRFYIATGKLPPIADVCGGGGSCAAYDALLKAAAMTQVHSVFVGAAVCAAIAGLVGLATMRLPREKVSQ